MTPPRGGRVLARPDCLRGVCHQRKHRHWKPDAATHDDLVKRQFRADAPDRVRFTDITQHRTPDGWVYCCAVVDAYSRRVVGWSIADHIRTELVVDALQMARDVSAKGCGLRPILTDERHRCLGRLGEHTFCQGP